MYISTGRKVGARNFPPTPAPNPLPAIIMRNYLRQFPLRLIISLSILFVGCGRPVANSNESNTVRPDTIINSYQPDTLSQLNKANEDSIVLSPKCFDIKLTSIKKLKTTIFIKDSFGRQISQFALTPNIETKVLPDTLEKGAYLIEAYDKTGLVWSTQFVTKGIGNNGR